MNWRGQARWGLLLLLGSLVAAPPAAQATRIRPGTISFGVVGDYGVLGGGSQLAADFNHGAGWLVKIRYRMRHGFVVGATFGEQTFQAGRDTLPYQPGMDFATTGTLTLDRVRVVTAGLEVGQVIASPENPVYFLVGAGVWSPTAFPTIGGDEVYAANKPDRVYVSGTVGTELFVRRTVTLDLSIRALLHAGDSLGYPYGVLSGGSGSSKLDHEVQFGAGLHFYVLD